MRPEFKQVKDIFLAAVEKTGTDEREAFLREACGGDDALRRRSTDCCADTKTRAASSSIPSSTQP